MIKIIIQVFLVIISIYAVIFRKKKLIIFLIGFGFTLDIFTMRFFNVSLRIHQFIGIMILPQSIPFAIQNFSKKFVVRLIILWLLILIILAIIYGYIFPWEDLTGMRMWNQKAQGRALVQIIRYITLLSITFYLAKALRDRNNLTYFLRAFYLGLIINVIVALINFITKGQFNHIVFNAGIISYRFTGLHVEPRGLARICTLGVLISLFEIFSSRNMRLYVLSFGLIGIVLAASVSALVASMITFIIILFKNIFTKNFTKTFAGILIFIAIIIVAISMNLTIIEKYISPRLNSIIKAEDRESGEFFLISAIEVFDRAAIRFLYKNPQYALFGVGPNLISIPASNYIPLKASRILHNRIDSTPHMGVIQVFSSYGFVGLFLWALIIFLIYNTLKKRNNVLDRNLAELFFIVSIFSMIVISDIFYMFLGLSIGYLINKIN